MYSKDIDFVANFTILVISELGITAHIVGGFNITLFIQAAGVCTGAILIMGGDVTDKLKLCFLKSNLFFSMFPEG